MSSIVIFLDIGAKIDRSQNKLYPVTERKGNEEEKAFDSLNRYFFLFFLDAHLFHFRNSKLILFLTW